MGLLELDREAWHERLVGWLDASNEVGAVATNLTPVVERYGGERIVSLVFAAAAPRGADESTPTIDEY